MYIGAHVSISGGYSAALHGIQERGGNCLQMFAASPRFWASPKITPEALAEFKEKKAALGIDPIYFHACYLINLANPERIGASSVKSLTNELTFASTLGVKGSIIHLGSLSNGTYESLIINILQVLENTPKDTYFIIENAGTRKIGTTIEEIGKIVADTNNDRVKICLDTCHLHAAGYDLSSEKTFDQFFLDFDKLIGLERLEVIHFNDSRDPFGSNRDRHENIGEGEISPEVFKLFLNNKLTKNLAHIIETPGFDKKGPDKQNIDIVKSFVL